MARGSMKISAIPPADMTQLVAFWITRSPIARPVRRRAVEAGILHPGQPPLFTHDGTRFMLEHAPRSPWSPPTARQRTPLGTLASAIVSANLR
jgi:hypothetical protein